jgi:hypothetical protein
VFRRYFFADSAAESVVWTPWPATTTRRGRRAMSTTAFPLFGHARDGLQVAPRRRHPEGPPRSEQQRWRRPWLEQKLGRDRQRSSASVGVPARCAGQGECRPHARSSASPCRRFAPDKASTDHTRSSAVGVPARCAGQGQCRSHALQRLARYARSAISRRAGALRRTRRVQTARRPHADRK